MIEPLPAAIRQLLEAQKRFDALREVTVRRAGPRFADLSYANVYDGPPASVREAMENALHSERRLDLQYTPYGGATLTRRLVARRLSTSHGASFPWRNVVMTPGAMAALNLVFRAVRREREPNEVVVVTPCWMDYPLYLENLGLRARLVPVDPDTLRLDFEALRSALGPSTRAVVLSQPANPTGQLHGPEDLRRLAEILGAAESPPLLVSDECHRDVVFDPHTFCSPVSTYDRTCVVYSFGKAHFMQGQRIGYVAVSPRVPDHRALVDRLESLSRVMGFCTPTALMQIAVRDLLGLRPDLTGIAARRERAIERLTDLGFPLVPSQATFFLYPRVPNGDAWGFTERLAAEGVLVLPSELFHHDGHVRLCLTGSDEMLDRALDRLQGVTLGLAA